MIQEFKNALMTTLDKIIRHAKFKVLAKLTSHPFRSLLATWSQQSCRRRADNILPHVAARLDRLEWVVDSVVALKNHLTHRTSVRDRDGRR